MLNSFGFSLPTRIAFGDGILEQTANLIQETCSGKRVFVVTDAGIMRADIAQPVITSLEQNGYVVEVFDRVAPNPKDVDCEAGGEQIRSFQADIVLAIGGGSVIDSAKAIALLHTHEGRLKQYEGRNKVLHDVTPLIAVPTTAGTGAEVTRSSVITDTERSFKMTVKDIRLAPRLAIVDPLTTVKLPQAITASTGMDAFVHAIEAYTCKLANPISDALALSAMQRIWTHLPIVVKEGDNLVARREMMIGSVMAGIAFSHADVASVHCMAEALGGLYDTPHGIANSIFLPVVTSFNAEADIGKHANVARICGVAKATHYDKEATRMLVHALHEMAEEIGIPQFSSLDYVKLEDFAALAEASFINGSTPSNCREITAEDYLRLFEEAYAGVK
ncbi:iron-containing alcohol dehydrogenase [Brevibacillus sp. SYSU BS000544]|uniref:iron-containing alcohol dehydrogenase n=1 Tax=Brevibacillus sp. SYSU BS000544 TaxID=3416443 RepID=UPI003CE50A64